MKTALLSLGAVLALALATGCFLDDEHVDCDEVCDAYDDCFGRIDEDACEDRCLGLSEQSEAFDERLERCSACVESATCAETAEFCEVECEGIVL